jgi:hypothetical protein
VPLTGQFEDVAGRNRSLVRKMLKMAAFLGKVPDVADVASIVDNSNQLVIPDGLESVGFVTADAGATITPTLSVSELVGYGEGQPIRRDIDSRNSTVEIQMMESKRRVFEAYYGVDLSAILASSATGTKNELTFDQPELPDLLEWRLLLLGRDGRGTNAIYHAEFFPIMSLTAVGARTWKPGDGLVWPITLGAQTDDDLGTPQRSFWAGPGLTTAKLTDMGFARAA